jgi:flagellar FliL protein
MSEAPEPIESSEGSAEAAPKKKGGLLKVLLLVLPFVLIPASAGAYLVFDNYGNMARTAAALGFTSGLQDEKEHSEEAEAEFGEFKVISDLLVNPAGTGGKRFLMVSIGLESQHAEAVFAEIDTKDAVVRDLIIQQLGLRTVEQLSSVMIREQLKEELRRAINAVLNEGDVDRLYFTQFVLQ